MKVLAKYPGRLKVMNRCWFLEKESRKMVKTRWCHCKSWWCIHIMSPPYSERMRNQKIHKEGRQWWSKVERLLLWAWQSGFSSSVQERNDLEGVYARDLSKSSVKDRQNIHSFLLSLLLLCDAQWNKRLKSSQRAEAFSSMICSLSSGSFCCRAL